MAVKPNSFKWLMPIFLVIFSLFSQGAWGISRKSALAHLTELHQENRVRLEDIDRQMEKALANGHLWRSNSDMNSITELEKLEHNIQNLTQQRQEHLLRQEFIDRLRFHVEARYNGKNFKRFMESTLRQMALTEAKSTTGSTALWKFLSYISVAVKDLPDKEENLLKFIEGYMKQSSIAQPMRPDQFRDLRNYTNGTTFVSARPTEPEEVGDLVEEKLIQLEAEKAKAEEAKNFSDRRPVLKQVTQVAEPKSMLPNDVSEWQMEQSPLKPNEPAPASSQKN